MAQKSVALRVVDAGSTQVILQFSILDSSKTKGEGLTGITSGSAGLKISMMRNRGQTAPTALTPIAVATLGTWVSPTSAQAGIRAEDDTNRPGEYQLHCPDVAFASGAETVTFLVWGATNMVPVQIEITLRDAVYEWAGIATALLKYDLVGFAGEARWSPLNALRFLLNEKTPDVNNTYISVKKEGAGAVEAYRVTITKDATAAPITRMVPQP